MNPAEVSISGEELVNIKNIAKMAGLNQQQFNNVVKGYDDNQKQRRDAFEKAKREIGEETLNVLSDYTSKGLHQEVANKAMEHLIMDKALRDKALEDRQRRLNSSVPGTDRLSYNYTTTYDDVLKARERKEKQPSTANRDAYIKTLENYSKAKKGL
jgi:hypothetical protein